MHYHVVKYVHLYMRRFLPLCFISILYSLIFVFEPFPILVVFSFQIVSSFSIWPWHFWTAATLTMPVVFYTWILMWWICCSITQRRTIMFELFYTMPLCIYLKLYWTSLLNTRVHVREICVSLAAIHYHDDLLHHSFV